MSIKIAIVGRPNVGKSALFNRIIRQRKSIVEEISGVTRDRVTETIVYNGLNIEFIDTAGIDSKSNQQFNDYVIQQSILAINEADAIIFVVDSRTGPTPLDIDLCKRIQRIEKPRILAINKVDNKQIDILHEFSSMPIR